VAVSLAEPIGAPASGADPDDLDAVRRRLLPPMPTDRVGGWVASLLVTLVAFGLRLHRLDIPGKQAFDELYYRHDSYNIWKHGVELDADRMEGGFIVHPPVGKWMLGLGQVLFGDGLDPTYVKELSSRKEAFSWRIMAAVFGALTVLMLCRLGRRLFRSTLLGCTAGLLMAVDGLHFTMSRIALLDIFLLFWLVAAAACLLVDRDDLRRRVAARLAEHGADGWNGRWTGIRPWRMAAGVCLGLAVGTKWSGVYFLVAATLISLAWEIGARRVAGVRRPGKVALRSVAPILLTLGVVPVAAYVASYAGWFITDIGYRRTCFPAGVDTGTYWARWGYGHLADCGPVKGFIRYQQDILEFHKQLNTAKDPHSYQSHPIGWLVLYRPVAYWYVSPSTGTSQAIVGVGTPAIWWASIPALLVVLWRWATTRDWRAGFIVAGFAANYIPWFWSDIVDHRTMFFFYALPMLPFICLGLAYCCGLASGGRRAGPDRRMWGALAAGGYLLLVIANFVWLYPVLSAQVIDYQDWYARMWLKTWI
jgi:dolichyl-phosphate-mannose--protein O-mannosyl transferase